MTRQILDDTDIPSEEYNSAATPYILRSNRGSHPLTPENSGHNRTVELTLR